MKFKHNWKKPKMVLKHQREVLILNYLLIPHNIKVVYFYLKQQKEVLERNCEYKFIY